MNHLETVLEELKTETPNNLPVGISDITYNLESNAITQGQCNTIIKLLVKTLERIEELERNINKIIQKGRLLITTSEFFIVTILFLF